MRITAFDRNQNFDHERFAAPKAIDRGAPFWSWNGSLEKDRLLHQLEVFRQMGLGGAHMHPRTGMATTYMSDEFLSLIEACVEYAESHGMHAWLYDEDRWPSGFAGGLATAEERYRTRHLRFTWAAIPPGEERPTPTHHGSPLPLSDRRFIAAWSLEFADDFLESFRRVGESEAAGDNEVVLYSYLEVPPTWTWFNNTQYVDTLNPEAMRRFIEVTHERYFDRVGSRFGSVAPAIFTDEPLFRGMDLPATSADHRDCFVSWTEDLAESYGVAYGEDLLDVLPRILFDAKDGSHVRSRWRFHNHHTDRFVQAFAAQVGAWCGEHGIALTGHMMSEPTLGSQSTWIGEAMRSLRHFQLPGIDMLCDQLEFTTAKQAQSIARQTGAPGTMSELYGVTNWDFPFAGHKRQGDWQAALGVITRVQHLTWYQMAGEAKRDYPASIGEHMPWWRRYPIVEDHFARLNAALRSGTPRCRVGMIHPIESFWLVYGPAASELERQRLEEGFSETLRWMLEELIDVDLISESVLADLGGDAPATSSDGGATGGAAPAFTVGEMSYDAVVVPPVLTLRRSTLNRLSAFAEEGGTVIMLDGGPRYVDAEPDSSETTGLYRMIGWQQSALIAELERFRDLRLLTQAGLPAKGALHQLRELPDGGRIVFVCRYDTDPYYSLDSAVLKIRGEWRVLSLRTDSGEMVPYPAQLADGWTQISVDLPRAGHVLFRLEPATHTATPAQEPAHQHTASAPDLGELVEVARLPDPSAVELLEENVLLLDRGEWKLDDGEWQATEEILRIDNAAREKLGMPLRSGNIAQPWITGASPHTHRVTVAFSITVDADCGPVRLALEQANDAVVILDGERTNTEQAGEWMDVAFTPIAVPALSRGVHRLEVEWGFGGSDGLEACYLVGDFGVTVSGTHPRLTLPVESLTWGNATEQGLAFYGGTIRYTVRAKLPKGDCRRLAVPHLAGALLDVTWPNGVVTPIYREPWTAPVPADLDGEVEFTLDCYGTRINTFGQVHNSAEEYRWWGPASWRTEGKDWADEYQVRPTGILVAPQLLATER